MEINAQQLDFETLNRKIKDAPAHDVHITNVLGQRYIGSGVQHKKLTISGIPGNALGAYLHTTDITVFGNAQDAVGDTMNDGTIIVHGNAGDTVGYAMRGGKILIRGNAGFRVGIHMKEYGEQVPVIVVGGKTGDFLGEYQAGGIILVLGAGLTGPLIGNFSATGMHNGKIYVRGTCVPSDLPPQVNVVQNADKTPVLPLIDEYCRTFGADRHALLDDEYFMLAPSETNIYRRLYCNRNH